MSCCDGGCRRKNPIRVMLSDLTGRVYAVTRYREYGEGTIMASEKHEVTGDVKALMAKAWREGRGDDGGVNPYEVAD